MEQQKSVVNQLHFDQSPKPEVKYSAHSRDVLADPHIRIHSLIKLASQPRARTAAVAGLRLRLNLRTAAPPWYNPHFYGFVLATVPWVRSEAVKLISQPHFFTKIARKIYIT